MHDLKDINCLQIDDPSIPRGDRTFQLLCRYFKVNPERVCYDWLKDFNESHRDWLEQVSESFLWKTNKGTARGSLDRYLHYLPIEAFPLDLLGILIYSRMCHEHVAVFVGESYWTTQAKTNFLKCKVFLAYRGNLIFDDSRLMTGPEYAIVRADVMRYRLQVERHNKKIKAQEAAEARKPAEQEQEGRK